MEQKILAAACKSRAAFESIESGLDEQDLSVHAQRIFAVLRDYYSTDGEASHVDLAMCEERVIAGLENPKHADQFKVIFAQLREIDVSPTNVAKHILEAKKRAASNELAAALSTGKSSEVVDRLIGDYQQVAYRLEQADSQEGEMEVLRAVPVTRLLRENLSLEGLIKFAPASLNAQFRGGIPRGGSVLVFARTEIGKTAVCCNFVRGFLAQGLRVLYLGNEDPIHVVLLRIICSITGWSEDHVRGDPEGAQDILDRAGYDRLVLKEIAPGTIPEIRTLVHKYKPDVYIVDQVRNLHSKSSENRVVALEEFAQGCRSINKTEGCVSVLVAQAHVSAHNKLILSTSDVDGSKTGIPGAVDVMIGVGANDQYLDASLRCMSLPKNKFGTHGYFDVRIDPQLSRIT